MTPSQGSHFFQNITSFQVGYFTVNVDERIGFIDWEWLEHQPAAEQMKFTRHLEFEKTIVAKINGQRNKGILFKPA